MLAVLAMAGLVGWQVLRVTPPPPSDLVIPHTPVSVLTAPKIGSQTAPAGMIVFSDFECPFCAKFAVETWPELRKEYVDSGRLSVAFWQFPIPELHPTAPLAAEASECAARQGKFWGFHDWLFSTAAKTKPGGLNRGIHREAASSVGLDLSLFDACIAGQAQAKVRADVAAAKGFGLHSTPLFFLGRNLADGSLQVGKIIKGARPLADFKESVESMLEVIRKQ